MNNIFSKVFAATFALTTSCFSPKLVEIKIDQEKSAVKKESIDNFSDNPDSSFITFAEQIYQSKESRDRVRFFKTKTGWFSSHHKQIMFYDILKNRTHSNPIPCDQSRGFFRDPLFFVVCFSPGDERFFGVFDIQRKKFERMNIKLPKIPIDIIEFPGSIVTFGLNSFEEFSLDEYNKNSRHVYWIRNDLEFHHEKIDGVDQILSVYKKEFLIGGINKTFLCSFDGQCKKTNISTFAAALHDGKIWTPCGIIPSDSEAFTCNEESQIVVSPSGEWAVVHDQTETHFKIMNRQGKTSSCSNQGRGFWDQKNQFVYTIDGKTFFLKQAEHIYACNP